MKSLYIIFAFCFFFLSFQQSQSLKSKNLVNKNSDLNVKKLDLHEQNSHLKKNSLHKSNVLRATSKNDDNNSTKNHADEIPVFLGGLKPLTDNQKSPTFMPIEKGVQTNKALNGVDFDNLNYTKVNNIKIQLRNESQVEVPAGYYGESRITYYV